MPSDNIFHQKQLAIQVGSAEIVMLFTAKKAVR